MHEPIKDPQVVSFGRMNITVPGPVSVNWRRVELADVLLAWRPIPADSTFTKEFEKRMDEDLHPKNYDPDVARSLVRTYSLPAQKRVGLLYWVPLIKTNTLEVWQDYGDHALVASTGATNSQIGSAEQDVSSVLDNFERTDRPIQSGFAVEGGVVHREFDTNETLSLDLDLDAYPVEERGPTEMSLETGVYLVDGTPTALARAIEGNKSLRAEAGDHPGESFRDLRQGKRTVMGMHGEEFYFIAQGPASEGIHAKGMQKAEFEFGGKQRDPYKPYLQVTLKTAVSPAKPGGIMLPLWDSILHSLRVHH